MFKVNKKNSAIPLGESNKLTPEEATVDALKWVLNMKGIEISQSDINLKQIDENTFEFSFNDEDYLLTKTTENKASQD